MIRKSFFYEHHGVEEYYIYDPFSFDFDVWLRANGHMEQIIVQGDWKSPLLGVRFVPHTDAELEVYYPDGRPFVSMTELARLRTEAEARAATAEKERDAERTTREKLAAQLRALGIEPEE
jgi:Uma2 family endonuclease